MVDEAREKQEPMTQPGGSDVPAGQGCREAQGCPQGADPAQPAAPSCAPMGSSQACEPARSQHRTSRSQRNFLGIYDLMLKTMQLDYACCGRYEASGYSDFIGKLYTLNASMFQSAKSCDRMLTQMMLHYLTWFQDPGVQLVVGPGAAWHVRQDFRTQRCGDALYVVSAEPGAQVSVGEAITKVNGMALDEARPEVERTLWTTAEPVDPEREDWSVVLAFAKHLTVRGVDGVERTVKLSSWSGEDAQGADGERAAEDVQVVGASGARAGDVQGAGASCELVERAGVSVLVVRDPADPGFAQALAAVLPAAERAARLVIDLRGCRGGVQEDIVPLVPLVLAPGAAFEPAQLFGPAGIVMNYSRHNADVKLAELAELRVQVERQARAGDAADDASAPAGGAPAGSRDGATAPAGGAPAAGSDAAAELAELDALEADLWAKRGSGFVHEMCGPEDGFYPAVTFRGAGEPGEVRRVAVLVDRFVGEAAEWLVRAARQAGFATIMGRATLGSLDNTCPRVVRLDEDYTLVIPTASYVAAHEGMATLGRGIVPDIHLAWTPEHLVSDVDLDAACEHLRQE